MSIDPSSEYAGQMGVDSSYPYGRARNDTVPGVSGDGTPLEEAWVNDLFGFFQHILADAGITPSGTPDSGFVSQVAQALRALTHNMCACYRIDGQAAPQGGRFPLSLEFNSRGSDFSLANDIVTLPVVSGGIYRVHVWGLFTSPSGTDPLDLRIDLRDPSDQSGNTRLQLRGARNSSDTSLPTMISASALTVLPEVELVNTTLFDTIEADPYGFLSIERVARHGIVSGAISGDQTW